MLKGLTWLEKSIAKGKIALSPYFAKVQAKEVPFMAVHAEQQARLRPGAIGVELGGAISRLFRRVWAQPSDRHIALHVPALTIDHVRGASPVLQCRDTIDPNEHSGSPYGPPVQARWPTVRPTEVLKEPDAETVKRIKAWEAAAHAGENGGGTAVVEEADCARGLSDLRKLAAKYHRVASSFVSATKGA